MNPAKRKKLARLEAAKKAAEVTVTEAAPVLKEEEKVVPEVLHVAEVALEVAAEPVVEVEPAPVVSSKKKKTV